MEKKIIGVIGGLGPLATAGGIRTRYEAVVK